MQYKFTRKRSEIVKKKISEGLLRYYQNPNQKKKKPIRRHNPLTIKKISAAMLKVWSNIPKIDLVNNDDFNSSNNK